MSDLPPFAKPATGQGPTAGGSVGPDAARGRADGPRAASDLTAVRLPWGVARGVDLGGVRVWRGLPYAAAPIGERRFQAPEPPEPWAGERDCSAFGATSPQLRLPGLRSPARRGREPRGSEDCLYLNVWSPGPGGPPRPVLVWIHGGGFVSGAGSSFDGARLAARGDVVVVTVNYRLGPWGHLDLAGRPGAGNLALLDQLAALRWVRAAAGAFGGDPGLVTVFGESAGAMYIGALLGAPDARGLFHRAVLQSGTAHHLRDQAGSERVRRRYLDLLDLPPARASTVELVRAAQELLAESVLPGAAVGLDPFAPSLDGAVLPVGPAGAVAAGSARDVPLLVTWCHDEAELFLTLAPDVLPVGLARRALATLGEARWQALLDLYTLTADDLAADDLAADDLAAGDPAAGRAALLTDAMFALPASRLADAAHAGGGRVWTLRFDPVAPGRAAMHGADLPLTWGRADETSQDPARRAAAHWQDALASFARSGDPSTRALPAWPRYDPDRRTALLLGATASAVEQPGGARHAAWTGLPLP
ncbi:carboxylesterase/lipase family protein [Frankia sp. AgB1.8]|uniref:carboxylesterase/lipase family protein n=1 Tax=Frankia sp. AgB1.8 TaxID=2792839 RepID=UPI00193259D6|nr:carboxylesterase family protein [Frankia sp. AgB1.8]MBL7623037.1 carboxylesterase family protein [Frankia sp. AgB1.8]